MGLLFSWVTITDYPACWESLFHDICTRTIRNCLELYHLDNALWVRGDPYVMCVMSHSITEGSPLKFFLMFSEFSSAAFISCYCYWPFPSCLVFCRILHCSSLAVFQCFQPFVMVNELEIILRGCTERILMCMCDIIMRLMHCKWVINGLENI